VSITCGTSLSLENHGIIRASPTHRPRTLRDIALLDGYVYAGTNLGVDPVSKNCSMVVINVIMLLELTEESVENTEREE